MFGGFTGIANVPGLSVDVGFSTLSVSGSWTGFIVVAVAIVVIVGSLRRMLDTPFGLAVDGVRVNEPRLQYLGLSVVKVKLCMFVISAAIAGLAGALFAAQSNYVASDMMGTVLATEAIIWVAVGGRRSLFGAVLGASPRARRRVSSSGIAIDYWMLFLGALLLVMVLLGSSGVVGMAKWSLAKIGGLRPARKEADSAARNA